ncbi:hypothetical protein HMPREF0673_00848 [Leyella stercorea DSM 18206]|uniref:Uncharacterized protein n=1 Tax=Leyella stercorea DSM 18206 TaxID=1002367 RepID=G6AW51_9BACT|nr:hypothetical protein HMPREF0673_00848 [Leyella stercorea DSM 18206]
MSIFPYFCILKALFIKMYCLPKEAIIQCVSNKSERIKQLKCQQ